jgi:ERCC4-type nuclease
MSDDESMNNVMTGLEIHVDYRETALIMLLASSAIPVYNKNLDLGDIHIVDNKNGIHLLFERKTTVDLAASVVDGRYSEQKARILSAFAPHMCTYIIEGSSFGKGTNLRISQAVYDGAIIHTMYRDRMHVAFTNTIQDTANFIMTIAGKCKANPQYFAKSCLRVIGGGDEGDIDAGAGSSDYTALLKHKVKKKDNITRMTCYISQLCQIPGVSNTIAKEIAAIYPSYACFVNALLSCVDDGARMKLLKKINMIADKKARTIIEYVV